MGPSYADAEKSVSFSIPEVSVIIPARNPSEILKWTIESLLSQKFSKQFEIILVDDHSDYWPEWIAEYTSDVRIIRNDSSERGRSAACHLGVLSARGPIIIFLDADCIAPSNLVTQHHNLHRQSLDFVGVHKLRFIPDINMFYTLEVSSDPWSWASTNCQLSDELSLQEKLWLETDEGNDRNIHTFRMFTGACASLTTDLYFRAGGLNVDLLLGEDTEFAYRLERHGGEIILVGDASGSEVFHVGMPATSTERIEFVRSWNGPHLAQLIPKPMYRPFRQSPKWEIPRFSISFEFHNSWEDYLGLAAIIQLLNGTLSDLEICVEALADQQISPSSPTNEVRLSLLNEWLTGDARVVRGGACPHSPFLTIWPNFIIPRPEALESIRGQLEGKYWGSTLEVTCCVNCQATLEIKNFSRGESRFQETRKVDLSNQFDCYRCDSRSLQTETLLNVVRTVQTNSSKSRSEVSNGNLQADKQPTFEHQAKSGFSRIVSKARKFSNWFS